MSAGTPLCVKNEIKDTGKYHFVNMLETSDGLRLKTETQNFVKGTLGI